jgi:hypothetical protein
MTPTKISDTEYVIELTRYIWRCGDGCCSDSGYKVSIYQADDDGDYTKLIFSDDDWEYRPFSEDALKIALKHLKDILGIDAIKDVDYCVRKFVEDDDLNYEDY